MKKLLIYSLIFVSTLLATSACGGEDDEQILPDRATMTTFRISEITGMSYPEDSLEMHAMGNSIHLHWFGVGDCAGYEIMYALQEAVAKDELAWTNPNNLAGHFIVSAEKSDTILNDLQYATTYSFAIRVLSNRGEQYHSEWFGVGTDRQWANICQRKTEEQPDSLYEH